VNVTVTVALSQPFEFGVGLTTATIAGGTAAWIFNVALAELEFPALSVAVPEIICPAPTVETVTGVGQVTTPDSASEHVNVTVALP
jgi:hypothetical protein